MAVLFHPAIALLNRLRYVQKFMLISVLFALPLAFAMTLLINQLNAYITIAQHELYGVIYLRPLHSLLEHALLERVLAHAYANDDTTVKDLLLRNQTQIDQDFTAIHGVDQQYGTLLQTTEQLQAIETSWRSLKERTLQFRSRQSDDLHAKFVADVHAFATLVGDSSKLILDAEFESHYVMEAVLLQLPQGQDLIAQTQLLGAQAITQDGLTPADKAQLSTLNGLLEAEVSAIDRSLHVAFRNNPAVQQAAEAPLREYAAAIESFLLLLRKDILFAPSISISQQAFTTATARALETNLALRDRSSAMLEQLLLARINTLRQEKYLVIATATAGLLLVAYLWVGFYLSVIRTVAKLDEAAKRMMNGDMSEAVHLDNHDELGAIARSFNEIATALIAAGTYRQAIVENAGDGIITIDAQGVIDSVNPAAAQIFGYAAAELIGQHVQILIPPPYDREYMAVGGGREVQGRHKQGASLPLDLAIGEMQLAGQHRFIGIVHDLTERQRAEAERARLQTQIIEAQAATLAELSTPLIPINEHVVVMPLIGALDQQRAHQVIQVVLHGIEQSQARVAILDITGVPVIDPLVAQALLQAAQGVQLLGAQLMLTGIRPEVAQTIVGLGIDLSRIATHSSLQSGIAAVSPKPHTLTPGGV